MIVWQLLKEKRSTASFFVLLTFIILAISCVSCEDELDGYEKFLVEQEQEYLEQVAKVFKTYEDIGNSSNGMEHIEFFQEISAIDPPSHFKSRHGNLMDVHILNGNIKLRIEDIQHGDQKRWKQQGFENVARCSQVMEYWTLPASSEHRLACGVLQTAGDILAYEMSSWKVGVFQVYEGDPYDLGN